MPKRVLFCVARRPENISLQMILASRPISTGYGFPMGCYCSGKVRQVLGRISRVSQEFDGVVAFDPRILTISRVAQSYTKTPCKATLLDSSRWLCANPEGCPVSE